MPVRPAPLELVVPLELPVPLVPLVLPEQTVLLALLAVA
jgi:hypothetical protein